MSDDARTDAATSEGAAGEAAGVPPKEVVQHQLDLSALQSEIIDNRRRRGWDSAWDIQKTALGIMEEAGEFARSLKRGNTADAVDALGDLMVFCLGGMQILGVDAAKTLVEIVKRNVSREHDGHH